MNDSFPSFRSMRKKIRHDILVGILIAIGGLTYGGMILYHVMDSWGFDIPLFLIAVTGMFAITAALLAASFYFQDAIDVHKKLIQYEREYDDRKYGLLCAEND